MRVVKQGGGALVKVSAAEVRAFMATYPCSGLRGHAGLAVFDGDGNLVEHNFKAHEDGHGLLALLEDMQRAAGL